MEKNYKKGFSLAEMLIVFLLISIMLAVFAPVMTKSAKKKVDPNCPGGVKKMLAEYSVPGEHEFIAPNEITGKVKIIVVSAGEQGGNGSEGARGAGGAGGVYEVCENDDVGQLFTPGNSYTVQVGFGGGTTNSAGTTSYINVTGSGQCTTESVSGAAEDRTNGVGGGMSIDGVAYGQGGAAGNYCSDSSCNPHGKAGSGYTPSGLSPTGFIAGTGGGGGGYDGATKTSGLGGVGGDGYVRIEYEIRCN